MATKTITTPAGIARFPSLNRADTKFDEIGVYKVNLEMSAEDAEPFIKQIEAIFAEYLPAKLAEINNKLVMDGLPKKTKLKQHAAPWEENDGLVQLKLKVPAMGKNKETGEEYSRKPTLFDAAGKEEDVNIGGGSKLKVAVVPYCWYTASLGAGITLQPKAVQVLDLVTWGNGGTAEAYGFDVSEAKAPAAKTGTDDQEISW
jgi:hypothetical protein